MIKVTYELSPDEEIALWNSSQPMSLDQLQGDKTALKNHTEAVRNSFLELIRHYLKKAFEEGRKFERVIGNQEKL